MRRIPDRRVVLHIGAPLTGAAYLRETLRRNRRGLTRSGVLYPGSHLGDDAGHLDAVLDVLGLSSPDAPGVTGAWDRLTQAAHDWRRGTVVVSHDLLADADEEQAHRIVSAFTSAEVHVVYVARDLGRQLPLAWQEWVRNGGTATFASYVDRVARRAPHRLARVFWSSHDVQEVLARWSTWVPAERVHVVTVPQGPDQDRTVWSRFALTLGIDPGKARTGVDGSGALQALAATEVQRLLNGHGGARLPDGLLAGLPGPVPGVPEEHRARVVEEAERAVEAVKAGGYDVVGDVTDLRPHPEAFARSDVQVAPLPADVQRAQTQALAATEVQRLLNGHGGARLPDGLLAGLSGPVPAVPEEHRARVVEEAERAVEAVKAGGYDVVGDVTDLRPDPEAFARSDVQVAALPADVQRAQTHALASALAPTPPRRRRLLR